MIMSIFATICNMEFDSLTDGVEIATDADFEVLETQARAIAADGTRCCIRWMRDSDGCIGYWGPAGAEFTPYVYN